MPTRAAYSYIGRQCSESYWRPRWDTYYNPQLGDAREGFDERRAGLRKQMFTHALHTVFPSSSLRQSGVAVVWQL